MTDLRIICDFERALASGGEYSSEQLGWGKDKRLIREVPLVASNEVGITVFAAGDKGYFKEYAVFLVGENNVCAHTGAIYAIMLKEVHHSVQYYIVFLYNFIMQERRNVVLIYVIKQYDGCGVRLSPIVSTKVRNFGVEKRQKNSP